MEGILLYLFICIIIAIPVTIFLNITEKRKREKDFEEHNRQVEQRAKFSIDFSNITDRELSNMELEELRKIYIQLINVENKIDKSNEHLKDIRSAIYLIAFCIVAPLVITFILRMLGVNILAELFGIL